MSPCCAHLVAMRRNSRILTSLVFAPIDLDQHATEFRELGQNNLAASNSSTDAVQVSSVSDRERASGRPANAVIIGGPQ